MPRPRADEAIVAAPRAATIALEGSARVAARHDGDGRRAEINDALLAQERALTQEQGLPRRPWFKHMIYAPGFYTGYAVQPLSAIDDAIADEDAATAETYRDLLIDSLQQATETAEDAARR